MSAEKERTPLEEAVARLLEQQADEAKQAAAEEAKLAAPAPKPEQRRVQVALDCTFDPAGALRAVAGRCGGRLVFEASDPSGIDLGAAAQRTLELGALRALLGAP